MLTGRNGYPHFRDEGLRPQIQLSQWFSVEITLYRHPTLGHWPTSGDTFGYHRWERFALSCYWAGARDAAKHPTVYRIAPTTKNCSFENISHAEREKS